MDDAETAPMGTTLDNPHKAVIAANFASRIMKTGPQHLGIGIRIIDISANNVMVMAAEHQINPPVTHVCITRNNQVLG